MPKYIYPAIFEPNGIGYTITFPDLPGCITEGSDLEESIHMATEAMGLHLYGMERDNDEIPHPSNPIEIKLNKYTKGSIVNLIDAKTEHIHNKILKTKKTPN